MGLDHKKDIAKAMPKGHKDRIISPEMGQVREMHGPGRAGQKGCEGAAAQHATGPK